MNRPSSSHARRIRRIFGILPIVTLLGGCDTPAGDRGTATSRLTQPAEDAAKTATLEELRDTARRAYEQAEASYEIGTGPTAEEMYQWSRRWLDSELELSKEAAEKVVAISEHLKRIRKVEIDVGRRTGNSGALEWYVAEAEYLLAQTEPGGKHDDAVHDRRRIQGLWKVVSKESDGAPVEQDKLEFVTFAGRRMIFDKYPWGSGGLLSNDASKDPKTFDAFAVEECDVTLRISGIYKFSDDKLTICSTETDERPTEFATRPGDGRTLLVLERGAMPAEEHGAFELDLLLEEGVRSAPNSSEMDEDSPAPAPIEESP